MIITVTCNPCIDKSFLVRGLTPEAKMRAWDVRYDPGGGGINVSRVIKRLGGETVAYGFAGGHTGAALRDLLDQEGLRYHLVEVRHPTRINITFLDEDDGAQYVFSLPGARVDGPEWRQLVSAIRDVDPKPEFLVISGSLPPGLGADAYSELAEDARQRGVQVLVDASGETLRATLKHRPLIVKPNRRELGLLTERELSGIDDVLAASREVLEMGPQSVIVSLGPEGALAVNAEGAWRASAPSVKTVSKVGAGDSMMAAIVRSLRMGKTLPEALKLGVAAGTAATISPGTELCLVKDIDNLFPKVEVTSI